MFAGVAILILYERLPGITQELNTLDSADPLYRSTSVIGGRLDAKYLPYQNICLVYRQRLVVGKPANLKRCLGQRSCQIPVSDQSYRTNLEQPYHGRRWHLSSAELLLIPLHLVDLHRPHPGEDHSRTYCPTPGNPPARRFSISTTENSQDRRDGH